MTCHWTTITDLYKLTNKVKSLFNQVITLEIVHLFLKRNLAYKTNRLQRQCPILPCSKSFKIEPKGKGCSLFFPPSSVWRCGAAAEHLVNNVKLDGCVLCMVLYVTGQAGKLLVIECLQMLRCCFGVSKKTVLVVEEMTWWDVPFPIGNEPQTQG